MEFTFSKPLLRATLLKRYKRFFADVQLETGEKVTAHCPNTGSMKTCGAPGDAVLVVHDPNPKRKLHYTWEFTVTEGGLIGINTIRPNQVVEWAVRNQLVPELTGYNSIRREVKYGKENSRIDLLLEKEGEAPCYVEIKNTTLLHKNRVVFPDAVTTRGQKHLRELVELKSQGARAVMFYFVNRPEGNGFATADDIDPEYGRLLREAFGKGVEVLVYRACATLQGFTLGKKLPIHLS